jgi:hypothetical protein
LGNEFFVNTTLAGDQYLGGVTALPNGAFVATWISSDPDPDKRVVLAQLFDAAGLKVGEEIRVSNAWFDPVITSLGDDGRFVIAWMDSIDSLGDTDGTGIAAQAFDASGNKIGPEFLVNTETLDGQHAPEITALSDDRFVVTWGSFAGGKTEVKAQIFQLSEGGAPDVYTGTAGADSFAASTGTDWQIDGLAGNDVLAGNAGDDLITGGAGRDVLTGRAGADIFVFAPGDSKAGGGVRDMITDFTAGVDKLDLTALNIEHFASEVTFKTIGSGLIVYVDTNGNGFNYSDFGVQLTRVSSLGQSDFLL